MKKSFCIILFLIVATATNMMGQNQNSQNWQLLGKVTVYYGSIKKYHSHGEDSYSMSSETAFLYSSFDGNKMNYKIFVSADDKSYEVKLNSSYTGAKIEWNRNGKYITYLPSLSEMYPHRAGPYYFNVDYVH